ncbi:hypothetical protein Dimus_030583 [Dionaea muscipula]
MELDDFGVLWLAILEHGSDATALVDLVYPGESDWDLGIRVESFCGGVSRALLVAHGEVVQLGRRRRRRRCPAISVCSLVALGLVVAAMAFACIHIGVALVYLRRPWFHSEVFAVGDCAEQSGRGLFSSIDFVVSS